MLCPRTGSGGEQDGQHGRRGDCSDEFGRRSPVDNAARRRGAIPGAHTGVIRPMHAAPSLTPVRSGRSNSQLTGIEMSAGCRSMGSWRGYAISGRACPCSIPGGQRTGSNHACSSLFPKVSEGLWAALRRRTNARRPQPPAAKGAAIVAVQRGGEGCRTLRTVRACPFARRSRGETGMKTAGIAVRGPIRTSAGGHFQRCRDTTSRTPPAGESRAAGCGPPAPYRK